MTCWRKLVANPCPLALFFYPSRACTNWSETLTYSIGGSSREGLDLGGSFGRFQMARRFGRKLQTPFIGFGKGQSQLLSSRLRVLVGNYGNLDGGQFTGEGNCGRISRSYHASRSSRISLGLSKFRPGRIRLLQTTQLRQLLYL